MKTCSWEYLEVGKTYSINGLIFSSEEKGNDYHILLLEKKESEVYKHGTVYTFLTKNGLEDLVFFPTDGVWFFELDN